MDPTLREQTSRSLTVARALVRVALILALVCGCALVAYARWTRPLGDAERAIRDGQLEAALDHYHTAEARFDRFPLAKRLFESEYRTALTNEVWVLYGLEQYDAAIDKAASSPAGPMSHFWAGCALFAKARGEHESEARFGWLGRANDEFRLALEGLPAEWDAKFNYELTERLVADLSKQPKTSPPQMMKLLRPQPKGARQPLRKTG